MDVDFGSQQRRDLEREVSRALLVHFGPHLAAVVQRGTAGGRSGPATRMLVRHGPRSGGSAARSSRGSARPPSRSSRKRRCGGAGEAVSWPPSVPAHVHHYTGCRTSTAQRDSPRPFSTALAAAGTPTRFAMNFLAILQGSFLPASTP